MRRAHALEEEEGPRDEHVGVRVGPVVGWAGVAHVQGQRRLAINLCGMFQSRERESRKWT